MKITNKIGVYGFFLKLIIFISLFISTYIQYSFLSETVFFYLSLLSTVILNDFLRVLFLKKHKFLRFFSLFFTLAMVTFLSISVNSDLFLYFIIVLIEIVYLINSFSQIFFLISHFFCYLFIWYGEISIIREFFTSSFWNFYGIDFLTNSLIYFSIVFLLYLLKKIFSERMEVIRLNEELNVMNKKLKDSILTIENLTISKERNRIAQEIHDTLGHCLTALVMHLEFLKKISDKENTKNLELIKKTENIARESMKELRKAVYALKEDEDIYKDFKFSLNNMAENISLNDIKVDFDFIGNVNELKLELKNIIFKTLQEIITNSLKHGKAKKINIKLKVTRIVVSIEAADDGIGCEDIIMGNGLKGIEQRFLSLGGIVNFNPEKNKGFSIKAVIPL